MSESTDVPVKIGVFTDIQYADKPNKEISYLNATKNRFYTLVLPKASRAVYHFNNNNVSKVLHLGDIMDGNDTSEKTESDLRAVLETLEPLEAPLIHVIGNHCLELGRKHVFDALGLGSSENLVSNRILDISPLWRFVILDSLALSYRWGATEDLLSEAAAYLQDNVNEDNATDYNGGIGKEQTAWLREELGSAVESGLNVVVCLHHPVSSKTAPDGLLIWNNEELQRIFVEFKQTVKAVFSGHFHQGGYAQEEGIHYVVFESILDSSDSYGSYGVLSFHNNKICIEGHGDMTSRVLDF